MAPTTSASTSIGPPASVTAGTAVRRWSPRQRPDSSSTASPEGTRLEDLGTHRLRDLTHERAHFQLSVEGLPTEFPPLRTLTSSKGNLPIRDLTLVGRQLEKDSVIVALEESRLVTLTGPGGVGKTTLALKVAEKLTSSFEDGVWFVEVSRVADDNLLAAAVARAAPHHGEPAPIDHRHADLPAGQGALAVDPRRV